MSETTVEAASWAFVLQHRSLIAKLTYRFKGSLDFDDLHGQIVVDLGQHGHRYDSEKGSASTFITWRIRAARTEQLRQHRKFSMNGGVCDHDVDLVFSTSVTPGSIERRILISQILNGATPRQREAAESLMLGLSGIEIRDQMGCGITARNARLYRLAETLISKENK